MVRRPRTWGWAEVGAELELRMEREWERELPMEQEREPPLEQERERELPVERELEREQLGPARSAAS